MKQWLSIALIGYAYVAYGNPGSPTSLYNVVDAAQEKARIVLMQINATFNWLDTTYAARERYYLTGIALDSLHKQKATLKESKEGYALVENLESLMQQLHQLDLKKDDFEVIQCKMQKYIGLPLFATASRTC